MGKKLTWKLALEKNTWPRLSSPFLGLRGLQNNLDCSIKNCLHILQNHRNEKDSDDRSGVDKSLDY